MDPLSRSRRGLSALKARRMKGAALFERGKSQADVVKELDESRPTACRWHRSGKKGGRKGLEGAGRAGRKPKVGPEKLPKIREELMKGPEAQGYATSLWTLKRIGQVVEKVCHVRCPETTAWRVVGRLGWSHQTPIRKARERNEGKIRGWRRRTWPAVKKKPERPMP